ncbi:MAG: hypothetical protein U0Q03_15940 [Acidimicrobiales bacterium]
MASIASLHNRRVFSGAIDWDAVASLYDRLLPRRPVTGVAVARAAAHLAAGHVQVAHEALGAIDEGLAQRYQPFWTVRADVALARGDVDVVEPARRRALDLTVDPAVRGHLERRWSAVRPPA